MKMITDNKALTQACQKLATSRYITLDTEFIREKTFWPELCLIQAAMPQYEVLIDPLAEGLDLTPFYELLRNKQVIKVMHGCRQDVEIFYHQAKLIPAPLMDTQVMAMVCGFGNAVSYEMLARRLTNVKLDKGSRFTNWAQRPLSDKQTAYALADVTHLRDIFEKLEAKMRTNGRLDWVVEEMADLTNEATYLQLPKNAWKRFRIYDNRLHVMGILFKVAAWREVMAQKRNIPRGRVLKDDTIREIALQAPKDAAAIEELRSIPKGFMRSHYAKGLIQAVLEGQQMEKQDLPNYPKMVGNRAGIGPLVELLKVLLKQCCKTHDVAPKLIAKTEDLERLASEESPDISILSGWRYDIFGKAALDLKHGRIALTCINDEITFVPVNTPETDTQTDQEQPPANAKKLKEVAD
ncbi:MAG: ribonuclease D [Alphaproteobacteria bacterium]|nr:ribonuclease D [Alphaproteobacteria bacterium]